MPFTAAHESKGTRHACQSCRDRKARFRHRGAVRADRDHTLCFECYRRERQRARRLATVPVAHAVRAALSSAASGRALGARELAHRQTILAHMAHVAAVEGR